MKAMTAGTSWGEHRRPHSKDHGYARGRDGRTTNSAKGANKDDENHGCDVYLV